MTHADDRYDDPHAQRRRPGFGEEVHGLGGRLRAFLRSRSAEEWIMFLAGLVIGLVLG